MNQPDNPSPADSLSTKVAALERFKRDVIIGSTIIGACMAAFLGYQSFKGIPLAIERALGDDAANRSRERIGELLTSANIDYTEISRIRADSANQIIPGQLEQIGIKVARLESLGTRQQRTSEPVVMTGPAGWDELKRCPDGHYVAGVGAHGGGGGEYCYNCVDKVKFVCEPFLPPSQATP